MFTSCDPNRYETARKLKQRQDDFCATAKSGQWDDLEGKAFPEDLQWEAMVDILRGKVKVRHSNISHIGSTSWDMYE